MKTLYEPSNSLEAQMIHDLLLQEGISTRIDGAYLQGGVGELPASGLVRLVVEEHNYERGRDVIKRWEATEVPISTAPINPPSKALGAAIAGLLIGVVGTYAFFHVPVTVGGNEYNGDGVLDERWNYSASGMYLGNTIDRNLDRKADYLTHTNQQGHDISVEADDNFDGIYESKYHLKAGFFEFGEVDTDGDSYPDLKYHFKHGVLESAEYINPYSGLPVRVEHFRMGLLAAADVDTNDDGKLDKRYTYSNTAKIVREEAIELITQ